MLGYIVRGPQDGHLHNESFGKLLYNSLKNGGSKIALVTASTNESTTYNEILQRTISLAQHLRQFGLTKGDTICICSENNVNFTISAIAALYLGITVAPMNHFYIPREMIHALNISKPKIVFCSSSVLNTIQEAVKTVKHVEKIIIIDDNSLEAPFNVLNIKTLLNLPIPKDFNITPVSLDDVAAIVYSSGTTGNAKGVMLSHRNLNASFRFLKHKDYTALSSTKIGMALPQFYNTYGFSIHLGMLLQNMKMIIMNKFEEISFLSAIEKYKINVLFVVPTLVVFLSKSSLVDNYDLSSVNDIICGAAPLAKETQDFVIKRQNLKSIRQGYGLTEATFATHSMPPNVYKSGTIGRLGPGLECKVINIETNALLGPNEPGELCIRGAQVMKGYCGNKEATAAILASDGWLHTGDVGYYDNDDYFYIVDRYKELIKYKGHQVPPAEIEGILIKHPQINECAVIGKPDEVAGELPIAFVVKEPNATITENDVIKYVAENVSYQKRLHGGVKFVNTIPKNPTGKILKRLLKDQLNLTPSKL